MTSTSSDPPVSREAAIRELKQVLQGPLFGWKVEVNYRADTKNRGIYLFIHIETDLGSFRIDNKTPLQTRFDLLMQSLLQTFLEDAPYLDPRLGEPLTHGSQASTWVLPRPHKILPARTFPNATCLNCKEDFGEDEIPVYGGDGPYHPWCW